MLALHTNNSSESNMKVIYCIGNVLSRACTDSMNHILCCIYSCHILTLPYLKIYFSLSLFLSVQVKELLREFDRSWVDFEFRLAHNVTAGEHVPAA